MKKEIVIIGILIIVLGSLSVNFYQQNNTINKNYQLKSNDIAIMIYDDNKGEYVREQNIPNGEYMLDEEKSYCLNGGTISAYDRNLGTIKYSLQLADKCYLYFNAGLPFEFTLSDNNIAWESYSGAVSYNVYSDGKLLTSTTQTSLNDLYMYYDEAGTYEIEVRPVKASGSEVPSAQSIQYTVLPYTHDYVFGELRDYTGQVNPVLIAYPSPGIIKYSLPSDVEYINFINVPELYVSGKYNDGGTFSALAIGYTSTTYLTNMSTTFCTDNPGLCTKYQLSSLSENTIRGCINMGEGYGENGTNISCGGDNIVMGYDSTTHSLYFKTLDTSNVPIFIAVQFIATGTVPSQWEKISFVGHVD